MNAPAWIQLAAFLAMLLLLAWPLARAIEAVLDGRFGWGRRIEAPLYRLAGVDPEREQGWLVVDFKVTGQIHERREKAS